MEMIPAHSSAQVALRAVLQAHFSEARVKNPQYTLRAFARKIRMGSGALSEVLSGRRKVSAKLAKKISENLGLSPEERAKIIEAFDKARKLSRVEASPRRHMSIIK
jgi:plasmid maintenance system antidote protein VapI